VKHVAGKGYCLQVWRTVLYVSICKQAEELHVRSAEGSGICEHGRQRVINARSAGGSAYVNMAGRN
jgi:hypothetical protein